MPNKLKKLSVTSVDLVDQGANPEAHVRLFKRKEDEPETDPDARQEEVEKEVSTFGENFNHELLRTITSQMFDCYYALSDSLSSIICDGTLDTQAKAYMMLQSLDEFSNTVRSAAGDWAAGRKASGQESRNQQRSKKCLKSCGTDTARTAASRQKHPNLNSLNRR